MRRKRELGTHLTHRNYTAESGSVVVTVKPEYLETLSTDKHTLTAQFDDAAEAKATFTVSAAGSGGSQGGNRGNGTSGTTNQAARTTTTQTATPKASDDTSRVPVVVLVVAAVGVVCKCQAVFSEVG